MRGISAQTEQTRDEFAQQAALALWSKARSPRFALATQARSERVIAGKAPHQRRQSFIVSDRKIALVVSSEQSDVAVDLAGKYGHSGADWKDGALRP